MAGLTDWWVELVGPRREGRKGARRGSRSFLAGKFWSPEQARVTLPTALSTPTEAMRSRESASDWRVRRRPIHRDGARRGKDAPVDRGRGSWVGGCRRARTSDRESPRRRARGGHRAPETTGFHLLAFSCQTRNFCSSCQAKRSVLFAEKLQERILQPVPHRHSIPKALRGLFERERRLLSLLSQTAYESVWGGPRSLDQNRPQLRWSLLG